MEQAEERIGGEEEDKSFEIIRSEKNKDKRIKKNEQRLCELQNTNKRNNLCITGVSKGERRKG